LAFLFALTPEGLFTLFSRNSTMVDFLTAIASWSSAIRYWNTLELDVHLCNLNLSSSIILLDFSLISSTPESSQAPLIIIVIINFILMRINIHFYLKRYSTKWPSIKFRWAIYNMYKEAKLVVLDTAHGTIGSSFTWPYKVGSN
jgi:hypothetical protein